MRTEIASHLFVVAFDIIPLFLPLGAEPLSWRFLFFRWGLFKCPSCFSCACYQERCRLVLGIFQNDRALPAAAPLHSNPESEGGHPVCWPQIPASILTEQILPQLMKPAPPSKMTDQTSSSWFRLHPSLFVDLVLRPAGLHAMSALWCARDGSVLVTGWDYGELVECLWSAGALRQGIAGALLLSASSL